MSCKEAEEVCTGRRRVGASFRAKKECGRECVVGSLRVLLAITNLTVTRCSFDLK